MLAIASVDVSPGCERFGSLVEVRKVGSPHRSSKHPGQCLEDQTGKEQAKHEHKESWLGGNCFQSAQIFHFTKVNILSYLVPNTPIELSVNPPISM